MKKAKIMLPAIAVIAVLSGTLAFKAHFKGLQRNYIICPPALTCTTATTLATTAITTDAFIGQPILTTFGTINLNVVGQTCKTATPVSGPCVVALFVGGQGQ